MPRQASLRIRKISGRLHAKLEQYLQRRDAPERRVIARRMGFVPVWVVQPNDIVLARPMDEHRHAIPFEQQRKERRQVRAAPPTAVRREQDRPRTFGGRLEVTYVRIERPHEGDRLHQRLAFDAQRNEDRAQLQRRHFAREYRREQGIGAGRVQIARTLRATADLLDHGGEIRTTRTRRLVPRRITRIATHVNPSARS